MVGPDATALLSQIEFELALDRLFCLFFGDPETGASLRGRLNDTYADHMLINIGYGLDRKDGRMRGML
jgi:hypothetical protein